MGAHAVLPPERVRLPAPADRHDRARRLAVWRSAHCARQQIARQARAQAARPGVTGAEPAQAQALPARLPWAIQPRGPSPLRDQDHPSPGD